MPHQIARDLLDWYDKHARQLPWRGTRDPYAIWVAEIMLQQTQVQTVVPYFHQWLQAFPDVTSLAAAPIDRVLQLWEGLGYYRRAHNLQRAARQIVERHRGQLPSSRRQLRQLPGIGPYTSAAVAAIAFNQDVIAVDGNLRRVLTRLFDLNWEVKSASANRRLERMAGLLMPPGTSATFNQGLMDLGATVCTPTTPDCGNCPLRQHCRAYERGTQQLRPGSVAAKELAWVERLAVALVRDDQVLLRRRQSDGLLAGLWEFPGFDLKPAASAGDHGNSPDPLGQALQLDLDGADKLGTTRHSYTHFRHLVHAWISRLPSSGASPALEGETAWVPISRLPGRPMGKVDRWIADRVLQVMNPAADEAAAVVA